MANNRQIPPLADFAFEALLRNRLEITPNSEKEYEILMDIRGSAPILVKSYQISEFCKSYSISAVVFSISN